MTTKESAKEIEKMLHFVPQVDSLFNVIEKVGEGTFSKVYRARIKGAGALDQEYALKYLVPTSRPSRIASELQCLKEIGGSNNIVGVEHCVMNKGHVVIVMPYFPHERFADYLKSMTTEDIRDYMKNLFIALAKVHENGIIHRDVKPNNFLYDRHQKRYALVDFGLAQRIKIPQNVCEAASLKPGLPLKEHNSDPTRERLNKSEPNSPCLNDTKGTTTQDSVKRPCQSTPVLGSKKRPLHFNQENHEHQSKKKPPAIELQSRNDAWQPLSSRVNILPTPPQTPSSSLSNKSKLKTKHTAGPEFSNRNVVCQKKSCSCFGKDVVCKLCLSRDVEEAPRGGTPGFRAPEVLLKHREQSTAIDMWSAGVILLSILSHKYPFFRAEDDLSALAEMVYIVGAKQLKEAATSIGKSVLLNLPRASEEVTEIRNRLQPPKYFQALCARLRIAEEQIAAEKKTKQNSHKATFQKIVDSQQYRRRAVSDVPDSAYDLLNRLLDPNPFTRITAAEGLLHPFILGTYNS